MVSTGMAEIITALSLDGSRGLAGVPAGMCAQLLDVTGLAVSVLAPRGGNEVVWRTDEPSARLDDLQFTLGQGPGVDAAETGQIVLEPDLTAVRTRRWEMFAPAAVELGVRAVFAVPLQIGAIRLGVLLAYREAPGPMYDRALTDTLAFADAATGALLGHDSRPGALDWLADQPTGYRAQVHQATGMITVQLAVAPAEALLRLRAHAFSQRRALTDVASDVVARRLRFDSHTE
jgi:hypothetical protein